MLPLEHRDLPASQMVRSPSRGHCAKPPEWTNPISGVRQANRHARCDWSAVRPEPTEVGPNRAPPSQARLRAPTRLCCPEGQRAEACHNGSQGRADGRSGHQNDRGDQRPRRPTAGRRPARSSTSHSTPERPGRTTRRARAAGDGAQDRTACPSRLDGKAPAVDAEGSRPCGSGRRERVGAGPSLAECQQRAVQSSSPHVCLGGHSWTLTWPPVPAGGHVLSSTSTKALVHWTHSDRSTPLPSRNSGRFAPSGSTGALSGRVNGRIDRG